MRNLIFCFSIICLLVFLGSGCEPIDPPLVNPPRSISLELSWGSIDFREDIYEYSLAVPDNIISLTITPSYKAEELQMRINNLVVESGEPSEDLALEFGVENIISLDLIRKNDWDSHYEIKIRINSLKRQTVTYDYVNNTNDRVDVYDYDEQRLNYAFSRFSTGNLVYFQDNVYNADGNRISAHQYQGGINDYNYYYFYNNNGFLTDYYCYDKDGALYWVYKYEYLNEKLSRLILTYTSGTVYTYDYEYNNQDLLERRICYLNGVFNYAGVYTYDSKGKLIVYTHYSNAAETAVAYELNYEYNEMGYYSKIIQSRTANNYIAAYEYEFYEF